MGLSEREQQAFIASLVLVAIITVGCFCYFCFGGEEVDFEITGVRNRGERRLRRLRRRRRRERRQERSGGSVVAEAEHDEAAGEHTVSPANDEASPGSSSNEDSESSGSDDEEFKSLATKKVLCRTCRLRIQIVPGTPRFSCPRCGGTVQP